MQQQEQRILKKLAEAREAQASTMSRFIQARARLMQVEARLQSLRAHLEIALVGPAQSPEPVPLVVATTIISDIPKPDTTPAAQVIIPQISLPFTPAPATSTSPSSDTRASALAEQARSSPLAPSQPAEQAASELKTPTPAVEKITPAQIDEDDEETTKMPSLRPASSTQKNPGAGETRNAALSALTQGEQSDPAADSNKARETGASDSTAKNPVMRREHDQTQGTL